MAIAYCEIADRVSNIMQLVEKNDLATSKIELEKLHADLIDRKKHNTEKVLNARRRSLRARRLHNVDNKLRYARNKNNEELIKQLEDEKEYIKKNIFD